MQDALKRLRALQQELENLHHTTAKVLAESEKLISQLEQPGATKGGPEPSAPSAPRRRIARRSAKRAT